MNAVVIAMWLAGSIPTTKPIEVDAFVRMPRAELWVLMEPALAYGRRTTIESLQRAIDAVDEEMPRGHPLYIGHISARRGGYLWPHKSHRTGRDVDISYFYTDEKLCWHPVTARHLDRARTWTFVRALITETPVQYVFIDMWVQKLLKQYAHAIGENAVWLDMVFQVGKKGHSAPTILHEPGHDDHIHVRFHDH